MVSTESPRANHPVAQAKDVEALMLSLGVALTMTGDAVSEIQSHLPAIAAAYGYGEARISLSPTCSS
jgi:hypothetical protein